MRRLTTASLALGLLVPVGVDAQQQVGQTGRALDANQRLNSGGLNPTSEPLDFSARNLLITGQVTGGRQFQGDPGFTAAGQFQGGLGTDDLFRFRADSATPGGIGAPASQRFQAGATGTNLGGSNIIFNNFFTPAAGTTGRTARTVVSPDGVGSTRIGPGQDRYNPGLLGQTGVRAERELGEDGLPLERNGRRQAGSDTLGRFQGTDGRQLQLDASPLFGVSESEVGEALVAGGVVAESGAAESGVDVRRTGALAPSALPERGVRELRVGGPGTDAGPDATGTRRPTAQARNEGALPAAPDAEDDVATGQLPRATAGRLPGAPDPEANGGNADGRFARGGVPLTVQLGSQLNPVLREQEGGAGDSGTDTLERLREQIFRPLDNDAADGSEEGNSDPYLDLLRRLRSGETEARGARPAWMQDMAGVPDDVLNKVEDRRQRSVNDLLRNSRSGDGGEDADAGDGAAASEEARSLATQLGYDGPRLETLRSNRKTRINDSLEEAESALAEGRYFDAESLYRQVVSDTDDQPLARVGLVHAQMAAGMIRSASLSLRSLFTDHPELISARYAERLLPPADRTAWLRDELQKLIDDPRSPKAEPALILAYLGRQVESRQLVRYGLALAEEAEPADPLFSVLRAAWLGDGAEPAADEAPALDGK